MEKTPVYLPDDLQPALTRVARQRGGSEAETIRESVRAEVCGVKPPRTIATLDRRHFAVLRPLRGGRFAVLP